MPAARNVETLARPAFASAGALCSAPVQPPTMEHAAESELSQELRAAY